MQKTQHNGNCHRHEGNYHIDAVQHRRGTASDKHCESPDSGFPVGDGVICIIGVKHRHGNDTERNREHQGLRDPGPRDGVCGTQHRQDAEYDEDIEVAEGVIFQERIKQGEGYCYAADNQQPGAAQQGNSHADSNSGDEQGDAELQVFRRFEFMEYEIGDCERVLVVHTAAVVEPVAQHVSGRMKDH